MVSGLNQQSDFSVRFWVPKNYWTQDQQCKAPSLLHRVESSRLPFSRRALNTLALGFNWPPIERYVGEVDWIYSPRETLIHSNKSKVAVTIHDVYHFESFPIKTTNLGKKIKFRMWSKAIHSASLVLAVSNFTKQRICEVFSADPDKIEVVGNGVEDLFFNIASKDPEKVSPLIGETYFIAVGGVWEKKGGHALLNFARILARISPRLKLVVIGPVDPAYLADVQASRNVIIRNRGMDDEEIARWIRGAVSLVLLSEYEGFGIPAVEAMAAGVPVIASNRAALPGW